MRKRSIRNIIIGKKKLFLVLGIILCLLIIIGIGLGINYIINKEKKDMEYEVLLVNNYLTKGEGSIKNISKYIEKDITNGDRSVVERSLDKYLSDIMNEVNNVEKSISKSKISVDSISNKDKLEEKLKDFEKYDKTYNTSLEKLKSIYKDRKSYVTDNTSDKKSISLYNNLIKKINLSKYLDKYDSNYINNRVSIVKFLNTNKDVYSIDAKNIVFSKRKIFNEFKEILNKINDFSIKLNYKLIDDKEGPKIEASDISIYKGDNINIKDKVKCVDDVDGDIECKISGDYDVNKVGEYVINISSKDEAGNESTKSIKLIVKAKQVYKNPYYTEVIRNQNTVIVYGLDNNNEYAKIVKVFPCSVGRSGQDTPTGTFTTSDKYRWGYLYGGVYGQYATRIVSDILFHSVPYFSQNPGDIEWEEYNKLGSPASLGCVRMTVEGVKWIYDNCPSGMTVKIYDGSLPKGVSKPSAPKIDGSSPNKGWDPTDPDPSNPWKK